jgi:cytoskeletal protein CcmA (bactofilin family)
MFNSKKKQLFANHQSLLSPVTRIVGDLYFSGDFYLEGTLKGNIYAEEGKSAKLIVAESSVVEGEIHVPTIVINGKVRGTIYSTKHVELAAKAIVEGAIHYQLIEMVKGSHLVGQLICAGMGADTAIATDDKIEMASNVKPHIKLETKTNLKPEIKMDVKPETTDIGRILNQKPN